MVPIVSCTFSNNFWLTLSCKAKLPLQLQQSVSLDSQHQLHNPRGHLGSAFYIQGLTTQPGSSEEED